MQTLSQLITACGDEFVGVRNFYREMVHVHGKEKADSYAESYNNYNKPWIADSTRPTKLNPQRGETVSWVSGQGETAEEAVQDLLEQLNK